MAITFTFAKDVAGLAGAIRPIRGGADFVIPMLDVSSLPRAISTAAMAAGATFAEAWQDRMDDAYVTRIRSMVLSDQAGTMFIESSPDQAATTVIYTQAAAPSVALDSGWVNMTQGHRWYRRRYVNGAAGQGLFLLWSAQDVSRGSEAAAARGVYTDRSGTITTGSTSQLMMPANPQRRMLLIQNLHLTEDLWVNFTSVAALAQPSIRVIPADSPLVWESFIPTEVVNVNAVTAGHPFTAKEG